MKTFQYTIRNIPTPVDRYLRQRAKLSGKSLNAVVIEELSERAGITAGSLLDGLEWFIGSGIDDGTLRVLEEDDKIQKQLARKEWATTKVRKNAA